MTSGYTRGGWRGEGPPTDQPMARGLDPENSWITEGEGMDEINWSELERLVVQGRITRRVLLRRLLEAGGIAAVIGPGATLLAACGESTKAGPSGPVPAGYPPINNSILGKKITLTILLAQDAVIDGR